MNWRGGELKNLRAELAAFRRRLQAGVVLITVLVLTLLGRLYDLEVRDYSNYASLAESNRISLIPVTAPRGLIYDDKNRVLADNYSAYTLEINPSKAGNLKHTLAEIGRLIEITPAHLRRFSELLAENRSFATVPLKSHLGDKEVAILAANLYRLPGVEVKARLFRNYPYGSEFSHGIGYIGRINDRELAALKQKGRLDDYRGSEHIGKTGLELQYENLLHGKPGYEEMETDAYGRAVKVLGRVAPVPGDDLQLNLDQELQHIADHAFGAYKGALVAINPNDGAVLALVSRPGFDPNLFVDGIDPQTWEQLLDSPTRPLVNRAVYSVYPPGSTIKPFIAIAALEMGVRTPSYTIFDPGYYSLPGSSHRFRDWKKGGHGVVDMHKAIVQSCDTYFYRVAVDMGMKRLDAYMPLFGFGARTGIDLPGESTGLVPSPEWKERRFHRPWFPGETVISGIGQGYWQVTPLQLAVATAALANGGTIYKPELLKAVRKPGSRVWQPVAPVVVRRIPISAADLAVVRDAMMDVTKPGGTAPTAFAGVAYPVAAKTGTAQVTGVKQNERYDAQKLAIQYRDNALFIAFAPADHPRIAVAVIVENGGEGGVAAAPIARQVMDYYLLGKKPAVSMAGKSNEPSSSD